MQNREDIMPFGSTFNTSDPRFQKRVLRAGAASQPSTQRRLVSEASAEFGGQQMRKDLALRGTYDRDRYFKADMKVKEKYLDLEKRKMKFKDKMHGKGLRSEEMGLYITTAAGLGTGILEYMQGRRRAKLQAEEARRERAATASRRLMATDYPQWLHRQQYADAYDAAWENNTYGGR